MPIKHIVEHKFLLIFQSCAQQYFSCSLWSQALPGEGHGVLEMGTSPRAPSREGSPGQQPKECSFRSCWNSKSGEPGSAQQAGLGHEGFLPAARDSPFLPSTARLQSAFAAGGWGQEQLSCLGHFAPGSHPVRRTGTADVLP